MRIDWRSLRSDLPLEYFALTVGGGKTLDKKAYFCVDSKRETGIVAFDALCAEGVLRPFSYGVDECGTEKYDFEIVREFSAVCNALAEIYTFIDLAKIQEYEKAFEAYGTCRGKILGVKSDARGVKSVCLYFRTNLPCLSSEARDIVRIITDGRVEFDLRPVFENGGHAKLYLVALDFSDKINKVKLYFKFDRQFGNECVAECLKNTDNYEIAKDIANSNGFIEGFQIAMFGKTTYNFYIKE